MKARPYFLKNLPPLWTILVFFAVVFGSLGVELIAIHDKPFVPFRVILAFASPIAYAVWRIIKYLPLPDTAYGGWLSLTPWKYGNQLPNGPVHLNITDFIILLIFSITICIDAPQFTAVPFILFSLTYVFGTILTTPLISSQRKYWNKRILIFALMPFSVYPFLSLYSFCAVIFVCLIITYLHQRDILKEYPWNTKLWTANTEDDLAQGSLDYKITGWPFSSLASYPDKNYFFKPKPSNIFLLAALSIWWGHAALAFLEKHFTKLELIGCYKFIIIIVGVLIVVIRLYKFQGLAPTISFWGRIFTGRFIIPKFDKLWAVIPLTAILITIAFYGISALPGHEKLIFEITLFILIVLYFSCPSDFEKAKLTSSARFPRSKLIEKQIINPQNQALNIQLADILKKKV